MSFNGANGMVSTLGEASTLHPEEEAEERERQERQHAHRIRRSCIADDGGLALGEQAVCLGGQFDARLVEGGGKGGTFMPLQDRREKGERPSVQEAAASNSLGSTASVLDG